MQGGRIDPSEINRDRLTLVYTAHPGATFISFSMPEPSGRVVVTNTPTPTSSGSEKTLTSATPQGHTETLQTVLSASADSGSAFGWAWIVWRISSGPPGANGADGFLPETQPSSGDQLWGDRDIQIGVIK